MKSNGISTPMYKSISQQALVYKAIFLLTEIRLVWNFLYGFRWPSDYVLSNNVFTYDHGFMPRALVASVLKLFFGDHIYSHKFLYILITGTSILILLFFIYMSYYFNFKDRNLVGSVLVLWYSLSIYSAYLSHEAGYFEQYAYVLLCILILCSSKIKSPTVFSGVGAVTGFICLLISETNAFLVLPTLFMMGMMRLLESAAGAGRKVNRKHICRDLLFLFGINLPNFIYCALVGGILVPESRVLKQLELIRSHSDRFKALDGIGGYFYNGSRMPESYTQIVEFKVWNWQLKLYLLAVVVTVILVLAAMKRYRRAAGYAAAVTGIIVCIYCLNFIAWDTERFKFGVAMAVTLFSLWVMRETAGKEVVIDKEVFRLLVAGTLFMFMIMDYRLGLFDGAVYNSSLAQFKETLQSTWKLNY